jgi:hypothetical protein
MQVSVSQALLGRHRGDFSQVYEVAAVMGTMCDAVD